MSHFNAKTLSFYGIAIGTVVVLFNVVSAYGNANLKAPHPIGDQYRINAQNLPGCLKSDALMLDIKQSGIYLVGSLLPAKTDAQTATIAEEKPSLHGRLNNQKLSLEGEIPWIASCHNSAGQADASRSPLSVKIQGVVNGETLSGQFALSSTSTAVEFTSRREAQKEQQGSAH
jgi:hypothetical protein